MISCRKPNFLRFPRVVALDVGEESGFNTNEKYVVDAMVVITKGSKEVFKGRTYLHTDGLWRPNTIIWDEGVDELRTGFFETQSAAQIALDNAMKWQ